MLNSRSLVPISAPVESLEPLLTVREVARLLQVSDAWVRDHANGRRRPHLGSVKLGKSRRFRPADVRRLVEECSQWKR